MVLHCATLNEGQLELNTKHNWNIKSVRVLKASKLDPVIEEPDLIVVDEAHRMRKHQLDALVNYTVEKKIIILFSYDPKQYLRDSEAKDINKYLIEIYPDDVSPLRKLSTKIRTNKKMASFINNMLAIGSSNDNMDYEGITIDYFSNAQDAHDYMNYLDSTGEWKAITFTASQYSSEPVDSLSEICELKAHGVIGQEFERVVFAMDSVFSYNDKNRLIGRVTYYSLKGMLYQIVTRAINELKIIVIDNPELYEKLIMIKHMGEKNNGEGTSARSDISGREDGDCD